MSQIIGALLDFLPVIGAAIGAVLLFLARQSGVAAERAKQDRQAAKDAQTISKKRTEARGAADADLDREVDKWSRKH